MIPALLFGTSRSGGGSLCFFLLAAVRIGRSEKVKRLHLHLRNQNMKTFLVTIPMKMRRNLKLFIALSVSWLLVFFYFQSGNTKASTAYLIYFVVKRWKEKLKIGQTHNKHYAYKEDIRANTNPNRYTRTHTHTNRRPDESYTESKLQFCRKETNKYGAQNRVKSYGKYKFLFVVVLLLMQIGRDRAR